MHVLYTSQCARRSVPPWLCPALSPAAASPLRRRWMTVGQNGMFAVAATSHRCARLSPLHGPPSVCGANSKRAAPRMAIQMISSRYSSDCQRNHCRAVFPRAPLSSVLIATACWWWWWFCSSPIIRPSLLAAAACLATPIIRANGRWFLLFFGSCDALLRRSRASFSHARSAAGGPWGRVGAPRYPHLVGFASLSRPCRLSARSGGTAAVGLRCA